MTEKSSLLAQAEDVIDNKLIQKEIRSCPLKIQAKSGMAETESGGYLP